MHGTLAGVSAVVFGLWLASGRETLTKHTRFVDVVVADDLFGDANVEKRPVRGPILGYYVGLDAAAAAAAAALVIAGVVGRCCGRRPAEVAKESK